MILIVCHNVPLVVLPLGCSGIWGHCYENTADHWSNWTHAYMFGWISMKLGYNDHWIIGWGFIGSGQIYVINGHLGVIWGHFFWKHIGLIDPMCTCSDGFLRNLDRIIIGWWVISGGQMFEVKGHLLVIWGHFYEKTKNPSPTDFIVWSQ